MKLCRRLLLASRLAVFCVLLIQASGSSAGVKAPASVGGTAAKAKPGGAAKPVPVAATKPAKAAAAAKPAPVAAGGQVTPSASVPTKADEPGFKDPKAEKEFEAVLNEAIALFKKNKQEEALTKFDVALNLYKTTVGRENAGVLNWIGVCQQRLNRWPDAQQTYEKIVALDPTYAEAHNNLAYTYQKLSQFDKAAAEYRQAISLQADLLPAHYNLARVLLEQQKLDDSLVEYEKVLTLKPGESMASDAIYQLGNIYLDRKEYDKATDFYKKALLKNPHNAAVITKLGKIEYERGDKQKADELWEQALDINPQFYDALLLQGIMGLEDKHYSDSMGKLGKALEVNPYDAAVHFHLGRLFFSLEQYNNSIKQFEDALKCDKDNLEAKAWLEKVVNKKKSL